MSWECDGCGREGGRLFDIDDVPLVPIMPPTRRRKGDGDARFRNDYPPEWDSCQDCDGTGKVWELQQQPSPWARGARVLVPTGAEVECVACQGMRSLKGLVRKQAGFRCVRCKHPYLTKNDARALGMEPTPYQWSPCSDQCLHRGPFRWRHFIASNAEWNVVDKLPHGVTASNARVQAEWRVLTVHHLDGDKANCRWWNLASLCQRCHLEIQSKVVMERVYPHEHSEWFKPYAAGYYAFVYLGEDLSREQVEARMDELLALERQA